MNIRRSFAVVCALCIAASLSACNSDEKKDEISEVTITTSGSGEMSGSDSLNEPEKEPDDSLYYSNGRMLFRIAEDGDFIPVKFYDEEKMSLTTPPEEMQEYYSKTGEKFRPEDCCDLLYYDQNRTFVSGNDYYGVNSDDFESLYHWSFKNPDMVIKEPVINTEATASKVKLLLEDTGFPEMYVNNDLEDTDRQSALSVYFSNAACEAVRCILDPSDGGDGYIYGHIHLSSNDLMDYYPLEARVVRYAKDGSSYEFIDGVSASAMTVSGGYIYFYDSGKNDDDPSSVDYARRGIYRIKTDGSERKKLTDVIVKFDNTNDNMSAVKKLTVIDGQLYFMSMSESHVCDLYRVSTEGGTPERYADMHVMVYSVDSEGKNFVYAGFGDNYTVSVKMNEYEIEAETKLAVKKISDGSETVVNTKNPVNNGKNINYAQYGISIIGDYIYLSSASKYGVSLIDISQSSTYRPIDGQPGTSISRIDDYRIIRSMPSGERINIKTGAVEKLFCYRLAKLDEDNFGGVKVVYYEPYRAVWKSLDEINDILKSVPEYAAED